MHISVELTRQEYVDFNKFHFFKGFLKSKIILLFLGVLFAIQIFNSRDHFDPFTFIAPSLIFILIFYLTLFRRFNAIKKIPREDGSILQRNDYEFTDERIYYKSENSEGNYSWDRIKELKQSKTAFYFYIDTNMAFIIPKRVFTDSSQLKEFEELFSRKVLTIKK